MENQPQGNQAGENNAANQVEGNDNPSENIVGENQADQPAQDAIMEGSSGAPNLEDFDQSASPNPNAQALNEEEKHGSDDEKIEYDTTPLSADKISRNEQHESAIVEESFEAHRNQQVKEAVDKTFEQQI